MRKENGPGKMYLLLLTRGVRYFVLWCLEKILNIVWREKMRNILGAILLLLLLGTGVAQAAWTDDFIENYDESGMSVAVEYALDKDVSPNEILTFIISNSKKFEKKTGLKALYCAGADRDAVREAANKLGITVKDLSMSLEESIAECGDKQTLTDRDLMDNAGGGKMLESGERDINPQPQQVALPEQVASPARPQSPSVSLPEQVAPPTRPQPSSPSAP
ncbi:MAG: hypothetical protein D3925_11105 [Candidatus Electrothrix sp. AR5]|nr:hypothetical protein [Candidatus Electrothrix sp. AR5]